MKSKKFLGVILIIFLAGLLILTACHEPAPKEKQSEGTVNSITINELYSFDGFQIDLGLFATNNDVFSGGPQIYGDGRIRYGTTGEILLYNSGSDTTWAGKGSWYVFFSINIDEDTTQYYISKLPVDFTAAPNAVISFSEFWLISSSQGIKIGEITGTITLTEVPNPAPQVYIYVQGNDGNKSWNSYKSRINLGSGSGTLTDISWSIPIYDSNDSSIPSTGKFFLWVEPVDSNNMFSVEIPDAININNVNANVGSLGTVSIKTIILRGTVNVTYNGTAVPLVEIITRDQSNNTLSSKSLTSPGANASWSIIMQALKSSTQVDFEVIGYSTNGDETLFYKKITPVPAVIVYNTNVSEITLNIGNISNSPVSPSLLTVNAWTDGSINNDGDVKWYSISVTNGTKYYLWWKDSCSEAQDKTLDIDVYAYDSSNNSIPLENHDGAWEIPVSFYASSNGTVYVRVRALGGYNGTGTYAIVYSTSNTRP